jgi:hypothetical protein
MPVPCDPITRYFTVTLIYKPASGHYLLIKRNCSLYFEKNICNFCM